MTCTKGAEEVSKEKSPWLADLVSGAQQKISALSSSALFWGRLAFEGTDLPFAKVPMLI